MKDMFTRYYQSNYWLNDESKSGAGSTLDATATVRETLPKLFKALDIRTLLDIPCGDFNWMSQVDLSHLKHYVGADVVAEIVFDNRERYVDRKLEFQIMDVTKDFLPRVDLVMVRDLFGHFSNLHVKQALDNIRRSHSRYLLATTFPEHETAGDIRTGDWRPINLASFFGLPDPILLINENCTEGDGKFADKSLGLWDLNNA